MHEIIQKRIDYLQDQIVKAAAAEEDLLVAMEVLPGANFWVDHEVNVYWTARSMDEVKAALKAFAEHGRLLATFHPHPVYPVWKVRGKSVNIRLTPHWVNESDEGASCKLVLTGEEVIRQPVYKLMCNGKEVGEDVPK